KFQEIVQKLAGFGEPAVTFELQSRKIAPQQNPMVELVQHTVLRVTALQNRLAKRVKRLQRDILTALTDGFDHASFHFSRGLLREGQPENILAGKARVGL